jgi:hypothetical protein
MEVQDKAALPSNKQGIIFGFATGLLMVVYSLILRAIHVPDDSRINFSVHVIFLLGILWFLYSFSKDTTHDNGFASLFKAGFRMVAIVTIVLLISTLLTVYLDPGMKERAMKYNMDILIKDKVKPAAIETEMKLAKENFTMSIVMATLYRNLFEGVLFSLAGAAIFKKNKV